MTQVAIDRREAVKKILDGRDGALVVTGLGSPSYDVHAAGDVDNNYYLWGAMGGCALTALGIAQAQRSKRVMAITGDGEMLMAFGALATIAVAKPKNLDLIVLDNGHFGETGMQGSHTSHGVSFSKVAEAVGFSVVEELTSNDQIDGLVERLREPAQGPRLFLLKIKAENLPRSLPPRDATFVKNRFRAHLGFKTC